MEGTHPTCHPVTKRVRQMILEGKIGPQKDWPFSSLDFGIFWQLLLSSCNHTWTEILKGRRLHLK